VEAPTAGIGTTTTSTPLPAITPLVSANLTAAPTLEPSLAPTATAAAPVAIIACKSQAALTSAATEGPYFKAGSPERSSLADNQPGKKLTLTGYVFNANCQPMAHAMLDFWQADSNGVYDNAGYTLRGHLFTDASGHYQLETVAPGLYPGRTGHIHVKAQAQGGPLLTTQLFFPGMTQNDADGIFDPQLLMQVQSTSSGMADSFNFVIADK
jgi:protocatechuate 3,4-dioxygenase beta subunit